MRERAAAASPEGVLVELFGHALRLQRVLALPQRLEQGDRRADDIVVGEHAPQADKT